MADEPIYLTLVVALKRDVVDETDDLGIHTDALGAMTAMLQRWGTVVAVRAGKSGSVEAVVDAGAPPQVGPDKVPYPEVELVPDPDIAQKEADSRAYRKKHSLGEFEGLDPDADDEPDLDSYDEASREPELVTVTDANIEAGADISTENHRVVGGEI